MLRLNPPPHRPSGPDGQGWNRLAVLVPDPQPQCALRPRTYAALVEQDRGTRFATYGHYGRCSGGTCETCPMRRQAGAPEPLGNEVLVRLDDQGRPWLMNRPNQGWGEQGFPTSFEALAHMPHFRPGRRYQDAHGEGFFMEKRA